MNLTLLLASALFVGIVHAILGAALRKKQAAREATARERHGQTCSHCCCHHCPQTPAA
ncbi:hypothetical protein [Streptomyces alfalfae]